MSTIFSFYFALITFHIVVVVPTKSTFWMIFLFFFLFQ